MNKQVALGVLKVSVGVNFLRDIFLLSLIIPFYHFHINFTP